MSTKLPTAKQTLTAKNVIKVIFDSESPEEFIRSVPAQTLYLGMRHTGIAASVDVFELASPEQRRLLLDFDCWEKDSFKEESFWEWLELTTERDGWELLKKLVTSLDLKWIAMLVGKYTDIQFSEEPTDQPPGPLYYTPDKGYTWVGVQIEDSRKHFLLGRLLAYLFESDSKVFYQIIAVPNVETFSGLEEQSFNERQNRLADEGIPSVELASELQSPLKDSAVKALLSVGKKHSPGTLVTPIEPLVYESVTLRPLESLFTEAVDREAVESELTIIANAAFVFFGVDFSSDEEVLHLLTQIKGALNIGLERAMELGGVSALDAYSILVLRVLYRLGIYHLFELRTFARKLAREAVDQSGPDSPTLAILEGAKAAMPETPTFFNAQGTFEDGSETHLTGGMRAIVHLNEIPAIRDYLTKKFASALH